MNNELEKFTTLVSWGLEPETVKETWAWENFEEAKAWHQFFEKQINRVRNIKI